MIDQSDALIVSHSEAVNGLVRFALGRYRGVRIRGADCVEDAQAKIAERMPQLVVIDVDSSAFDGFALVSEVRDRGIRVVAINDRFAGPSSRAAVAGANGVADVPFQPAKLHAAIEDAWTSAVSPGG